VKATPRSEVMLAGIDLLALGFRVTERAATHIVLSK
jgi:hypothetical protein